MEKEDFINYLIGKGLADPTVKRYAKAFVDFDKGLDNEEFDQGYVDRFINKHPSNVTRAFVNNLIEFAGFTNIRVVKRTGRKGRKIRKSLTLDEVKKLRNILFKNNIRYLLLFDLSYYCALRKSEVLGILIDDFNLQAWAENPTNSCRLLIRGKGSRERVVPVKPKIMENVIDYIVEQNKISGDRLFKFSSSRWQEAFKEAVRSITDYNYTLHDLRRSRASQWLMDGVDLSRVKDRLGHQSVATTQLYINLDEEKELELWENE